MYISHRPKKHMKLYYFHMEKTNTIINGINITLQSTLIISKSKGPYETIRDIRTSTYQIFRIRKIQIAQPNFTNEYVIRLL